LCLPKGVPMAKQKPGDKRGDKRNSEELMRVLQEEWNKRFHGKT
jgi:hypothetical protein